MSDNFILKSFLFEVVHTQDNTVFASFTLVIPPQRLTIREPQRVNITKTFGNAFIDDYGPDNPMITISGFSGTSKAFPTFQTSGKAATKPIYIKYGTPAIAATNAGGTGNFDPTQGYNSQAAFYVFRDTIMRYKDNTDFDQYELRVYDLGDGQAYKCILLDFVLDRSADMPFRYPYTINLFVYARMGTLDVQKASPVTIAQNPAWSLANITAAVNSLTSSFPLLQKIQDVKNSISLVAQQATQLAGAFTNWLNYGQSIIESPLWAAKTLISTIKSVNNAVYNAFVVGLMTLNDYVNAKENLNYQLQQALGTYGFAINSTTSGIKTVSIQLTKGMDYVTDPLTPLPTSREAIFSYTGVTIYTVKGGDTLQSIAQAKLGDSSAWIYIASINANIKTNADLLAGSTIVIPTLYSKKSANKNKFIISENPNADPYGTDITLDSNGNLVIDSNGDLAI
jgi:hypothetical protein